MTNREIFDKINEEIWKLQKKYQDLEERDDNCKIRYCVEEAKVDVLAELKNIMFNKIEPKI